MKRNSVLLIAGAAIVLGWVVERADAQTLKAHQTLALSAATRKPTTAKSPAPLPAASGFRPNAIPNWDGTPSGFDIVVCPPPRRRGN